MRKFSAVIPARQSACGFNSTKLSALFVGSAWAPTSPRPIRVTIDLISGNAPSRRFSIRVVVAEASVREIDGAIVIRSNISPSSKAGVNSEPSLEPAKPPASNRTPASKIAAKRRRTKRLEALLTYFARRSGFSALTLGDRRMSALAIAGAISAA